jgi:hypothetical protein
MDAGVEKPVSKWCNPKLPPPEKCEAVVDNDYGTGILGTTFSWGGSCYAIWPNNGNVGWAEAQTAFCGPWGGFLWTVNCEEELQAVISLLPLAPPNGFGEHSWQLHVGGTDREVEGTWRWISGQPWDSELIRPNGSSDPEFHDILRLYVNQDKQNRHGFQAVHAGVNHFLCER